ncbi:hypothetical protein FEM48_Zijuj02G0171800 [Ziziphus jujuba var. spinosa]|uniref:Pentatricopeptide repeat-containing protein n=1 Tax=Ziziphus jujuba var. spinosa TaxID=714518 RepID=A0A978VWX5_ZIZJJ|nr:hypothetical protein FEM48_Zijuj02G0171800 [Ziziphus jujuba var. spinosa]
MLLGSYFIRCKVMVSFPNLQTYAVLLDGLYKNQQLDEAMELFSEMEEKKLDLDMVIYNILIGEFVGGRISGAIDCLEMEEKGYIPDSCTYNIMICELITNNQTSKAVELNKEMVEGCFSADLSTAAMFVDLISKAMLALEVVRDLYGESESFLLCEGSLDLGDLKSGVLLLQNHFMYNYPVNNVGRTEVARELFYKMQDDGQLPDLQTYGVLLDGLCKSKQLDEAMELFSEMEEKNWIYNILIGGLCKTGKLEAAKDIFYSLSCKG